MLAELRSSNPLLTKEQEQAAMQRLLNQGTQSVSAWKVPHSVSHNPSCPCILQFTPLSLLPDRKCRQALITLVGCLGGSEGLH